MTTLVSTLHDRETVQLRLERLSALLDELDQLCAQSVAIRDASARTHDELRRITESLQPVTRGLFGELEPE